MLSFVYADHNLVTHLSEHGSPDDQIMCHHLSKCKYFMNIVNLMNLPDIDSMNVTINKKEDFDTCCFI